MEWKKKKGLAPLTSDAAEEDWILMLYETESEDRVQRFDDDSDDDSSDTSSDGPPTLASDSSGSSTAARKVLPKSPASSSSTSSSEPGNGEDWAKKLEEMEPKVDAMPRIPEDVIDEWEDFPVEDLRTDEAPESLRTDQLRDRDAP